MSFVIFPLDDYHWLATGFTVTLPKISLMNFNDTQIAFSNRSNSELKRAWLLFSSLQNRFLFRTSESFITFCIKKKVPVDWIVKPTVFRQFCGGTKLEECIPVVSQLGRFNVKGILDYSAESGDSQEVIEETLTETLRSIDLTAGHPNIAYAVFKPTAFCKKEVLKKMSSSGDIDPEILLEANSFRSYVDLLCKLAYDKNVPIMIDAEDFAFQKFIDNVVEDMMEKYNKEKAIVYNTLQMYRTDRLEFYAESLEKAKRKNYFLGIKLVRGAYMERERLRAQSYDYPSPIWPNKEETDIAFDKAQEFSIRNIDHISLFSGTHNEHSCIYLAELMKQHNLPNNDPRVYFSQLYGMSDQISFNLAKQGYNVAKYIPYGPVNKVLPYLLRRAEENSSIADQTGRELKLITTELKRRRKK